MPYHYRYNRALLPYSSKAKKNQTNAEALLWFYLRNRQLDGHKFRRQYPIQNYILDFYCVEAKLAIELDGSQHLKNKLHDDKRAQILLTVGIRVIRFWDNEVLQNIDEVLECILKEVESQPHPTLS